MKSSSYSLITIAVSCCFFFTATTDAFAPIRSAKVNPTIWDATIREIRTRNSPFLCRDSYTAVRNNARSSSDHEHQEKEASSKPSVSSKSGDCECDEQKPGLPPPLQPFIEALNPRYKCIGPVGQGSFVVSRTGGPTMEELSNENLYKILMIECSDLEVNTVVWKCLGYRFDEEKEEWTAAEVFPNWKEKFPTPPDLIGMARIYSKEVDQPSLRANQSLVRSVPVDNKQSLKTHLKPLGFTGYKVGVIGCCGDLYSFAIFCFHVVVQYELIHAPWTFTHFVEKQYKTHISSMRNLHRIKQEELNVRIGSFTIGKNCLGILWKSSRKGED